MAVIYCEPEFPTLDFGRVLSQKLAGQPRFLFCGISADFLKDINNFYYYLQHAEHCIKKYNSKP